MDEVWLVSLCLTFLAFVIALLSLRKADNEAEGSAKAKERSAEPAFASVQPAPRFMEMTLEDIGKSLERLGAVLGAEVETQSGAEVPGAPGSKARAFAVKALPVPKAELVNQHFDTEEWEFEDEEEMDALQHEGAEKQYYHLYWDNESLPDRSNYSVVEKTDLTKRKQTYKLETSERDITCSDFLQSDCNPPYQEHSGKQHTNDQLIRLQRSGQINNDQLKSYTICHSDSTSQVTTTELSKSLQPAKRDKVDGIDTELNLNSHTDTPASLECENHASSWIGRDTNDDGRFGFEEFNILNYKLQTSYGTSDSESSSVDNCLPPSPRLRKRSPIPLSLSYYTEREDSSSTDDISSSPPNSKDSRLNSCDESSSSDISLLSFMSASSFSESSYKSADSKDPRNSTLARMRTGLVISDDLVCSVAKQNAITEEAASNLQNKFTKTCRKDSFLGGQKCAVHSCLSSSEQSLTRLCTIQPTTLHGAEPSPRGTLLNVENAGYPISSEYSGEPTRWTLENQYGRKPAKYGNFTIHKFSCCVDADNQKEMTFWETRSGQKFWPDFNQVKIEPSTQAESQKHGGREGIEIMEHPPVTSSTRNIMEQIEQAVQETPDHNRARSEYIRVRRAPPAPRFETPPRDDVPQSRSLHSSD
ncbi:uncharacterized protein [Narcine bancroftii]|uniref:uncharacterized protein isoform X1 n=1 Tax=Narcine bancroftii TaxID=1343680 RepID=UPI003831BFDD